MNFHKIFLFFAFILPVHAAEQLSVWSQKKGEKPEPISKDFLTAAASTYGCLNESNYYKPEALAEVLSKQQVQKIPFVGAKKTNFEGLLFKRSSPVQPTDKLVVVGPPIFTGPELMMRYAGIFENNDVLLLPPPWKLRKAIRCMMRGSFQFIRDGQSSMNKVFEWAEKNGYTNLCGVGPCLGGLGFATLQHNREAAGLTAFNHLILESAPVSVEALGRNFSNNPCGVITAGKKQTPAWSTLIGKCLQWGRLLNCLAGCCAPPESIVDALSTTNIPITLMQGAADPMVTNDDVRSVLAVLRNQQSCAYFFENHGHLHPHLKSKEVYAAIVNQRLRNVATTVLTINGTSVTISIV